MRGLWGYIMSLATDILKHSGSLIPSRKVERREPLSYPKRPAVKYKAPEHTPVKGVHWMPERRMWRACYCVDNRVIAVGIFHTQERASIAYRLYEYWVKCGLGRAPTKTEKRLYTRRNTSDKS